MFIQSKAGCRSRCCTVTPQPDDQRRSVLQRNHRCWCPVWFDESGRQSGEIGVDRYFEQQVSLAGFADVAENALDDIPIIWASTPAREMGYTTAERILQRIGNDDSHSRNLTLSARLVTQK